MSADEVEFEAVPGLPGDLPAGEEVIWQGRPDWKALARQTYKVRYVTAYLAIMFCVRFFVAIHERQGVSGAVQLLLTGLLAGACVGVLNLMAWLNARSTIYTITNRRVVMRIGVAIPMTWNLPFKRIASANLLARKDGEGDISLQLTPPNRIAWLHLWPHVQPRHLVRARPTLRAIPEPARVAALLASAVEDWSASSAAAVLVADPGAFVPANDGELAPRWTPAISAEKSA